jgi:hypothetical protein
MSKEYKNRKAKVISSPTNDSSLMTAKALDAYMRFRAKHEGVGYTLSPKFFADHIEQGCQKCFGVTFQNGHLVDDEEQPELFRRWTGKHVMRNDVIKAVVQQDTTSRAINRSSHKAPQRMKTIRKIYDVFMKATREGNVPFGYYGPETCRWATQEEMPFRP